MSRLVLAALVTIASLIVIAPGGSSEAVVAGRNGKIAFAYWDYVAEVGDIYVMNADGSGRMNLTNDAVFQYGPAWSPDGSKIAFEEWDGEQNDIVVMNWDGSDRTQLTDAEANEGSPAWSPDGSMIAFERDTDAGYDIFLMNADGSGTPTNITNTGDGFKPAWSPDGSRIVFGSGDLYTVASDGSDIAPLGTSGFSPSWSPDGSRIAYYTSMGGNFDIYVIPAVGGVPERLTDDPAFDGEPVWSPDGQYIMFFSRRHNADPFNCGPACNEEIYIVDADGDDETRITDTPNEEAAPDWQRLPSMAGDSDCDGGVDSVDALHDLRYVAGIGQPAACIVVGNVSCLDGLTAVDSLFILRYVAQLPVNLPSGCPEIGS